MIIEYDITIVGGGMNGATLALALADTGLKVAMIEAHALNANNRPSYDDRAIALAHGSARILENLGVWKHLRRNAAAIHHIQVSDRGHFGSTRLDREQEGVEALGYVATARAIGAALNKSLNQLDQLQLFCPATLESFDVNESGATLRLLQDNKQLQLETKLLIAADGAESPIRKQLDIPVREWNYGHHAVIANITPERPHNNVAFERFTDTGPLAVLPMTNNRCAIVWTTLDDQVDEILSLDDQAFLNRLQQRFGYRLGKLTKAGKRAAYPLKMMQVREHYRPRTIFIGNAAHTVHPIAGQGCNLGIRDVAVLAEIIEQTTKSGDDVGSAVVLQRYAAARDEDQNTVTLATDVLARLFTNPLPPLVAGRNVGLTALNLIPGAKHLIARQAMGLRGRLPRLAR